MAHPRRRRGGSFWLFLVLFAGRAPGRGPVFVFLALLAYTKFLPEARARARQLGHAVAGEHLVATDWQIEKIGDPPPPPPPLRHRHTRVVEAVVVPASAVAYSSEEVLTLIAQMCRVRRVGVFTALLNFVAGSSTR